MGPTAATTHLGLFIQPTAVLVCILSIRVYTPTSGVLLYMIVAFRCSQIGCHALNTNS